MSGRGFSRAPPRRGSLAGTRSQTSIADFLRTAQVDAEREDDVEAFEIENTSDSEQSGAATSLPRKETRLIHEYFTPIVVNGQAKSQCKFCNVAPLSTPDSTTNTMIRHLKASHMVKYQEYIMKAEGRDKEKDAQKAKKRKSSDGQQDIRDSVANLNPLPTESARAKAIKKAILEMIILDYQPISIVEDVGFKRLISFFEKRFVMPKRHYFSQKLLTETYNKCREKLQKILDQDLENVMSIAITTDGWSSQNGKHHYFSLTLHYLSRNFEYKSWVLECSHFPESHTAEMIYEKIKKLAKTWNIDIEDEARDTFIITDNARNMRAAFANKEVKPMKCSIHTLQLAIEDALSTVNIEPILKKVRAGVGHYNHSSISRLRFADLKLRLTPEYKDLELVQMVATRWNSTYLMLKRYITLEKALRVDLPDCNNGDLILQESDWSMIKGITLVLEPLYEATLDLGKRTCPTLSMVITIVASIQAKLEKFFNSSTNRGTGVQFARALHRALHTRFAFLLSPDCEEYLLATIIDPRFKSLLLKEDDAERAKTLLIQQASFRCKSQSVELEDSEPSSSNSAQPKESQSSLWSILAEKRQQWKEQEAAQAPVISSIAAINREIEDYLKMAPLEQHEDPWTWWRQNSQTFKNLAPVALLYLGIPASSIDSERLFSELGQILTSRRLRLSPTTVEHLVFLHANYIRLDF